jgi:hypothetical protein
MTLHAVESIRRFLLHVLPSGFVHIRHFGFLANRHRKEKLALCRRLLSARQTVSEPSASSPKDPDLKNDQCESRLCPVCQIGRLVFIEVIRAEALARLPAPATADTS